MKTTALNMVTAKSKPKAKTLSCPSKYSFYKYTRICGRISGSHAHAQGGAGYIRAVDVAEKLGFTLPGVSYATKRMQENGYITPDPARMIVLPEP